MKKILEYFFTLIFLLASFLICFQLIKNKKEQQNIITFIGEGKSMEPTFYDGEVLKVNKEKKPREGDVIIFECLNCDLPAGENNVMAKRLQLINKENCYWVEGDNKEISLDSRDSKIGWLCPKDINLLGVVIGVEK